MKDLLLNTLFAGLMIIAIVVIAAGFVFALIMFADWHDWAAGIFGLLAFSFLIGYLETYA